MVLLRLVNLALQRVPKMVRDDRGATALTIFGQILPLLAQERLRCATLGALLPACSTRADPIPQISGSSLSPDLAVVLLVPESLAQACL